MIKMLREALELLNQAQVPLAVCMVMVTSLVSVAARVAKMEPLPLWVPVTALLFGTFVLLRRIRAK